MPAFDGFYIFNIPVIVVPSHSRLTFDGNVDNQKFCGNNVSMWLFDTLSIESYCIFLFPMNFISCVFFLTFFLQQCLDCSAGAIQRSMKSFTSFAISTNLWIVSDKSNTLQFIEQTLHVELFIVDRFYLVWPIYAKTFQIVWHTIQVYNFFQRNRKIAKKESLSFEFYDSFFFLLYYSLLAWKDGCSPLLNLFPDMRLFRWIDSTLFARWSISKSINS